MRNNLNAFAISILNGNTTEQQAILGAFRQIGRKYLRVQLRISRRIYECICVFVYLCVWAIFKMFSINTFTNCLHITRLLSEHYSWFAGRHKFQFVRFFCSFWGGLVFTAFCCCCCCRCHQRCHRRHHHRRCC